MQVIRPGIGIDESLWVSVSVRNVGNAATTLTHFCGVTYNNRFNEFRGESSRRFVITTGPESPIPHKLGPGETWSGMVPQEALAASVAASGARLHLGVQHSMAEKPALVRVDLPTDNG